MALNTKSGLAFLHTIDSIKKSINTCSSVEFPTWLPLQVKFEVYLYISNKDLLNKF